MKNVIVLFGFAVIMFSAVTTNAHHSYIIYDGQAYGIYKGVFKEDKFNSGGHAYFLFDITMPDGEVVTWKAESQGAGRWPEDRLTFSEVANVGDEVTVTGWPLRNGRPVLFLHTMAGIESGKSLSVDNRTVPGASNFTFSGDEVNPDYASQLPKFTPDGERVFTSEGYLTHAGERLLEQLTGKDTMDEDQESRRRRQRRNVD